MGYAAEMRGKDPRHNMDMVHQAERGVSLSGAMRRIQSGKRLHELIIGPGLVGKQALQQGLGSHLRAHLRW